MDILQLSLLSHEDAITLVETSLNIGQGYNQNEVTLVHIDSPLLNVPDAVVCFLQVIYLSWNRKLSAVPGSYPGQVHELRYIAPMIGDISHEQLVERTEATRYASRKAHKPYQQLLVATELSHMWQKVVQVHTILRPE
jgi:hypothetical protein